MALLFSLIVSTTFGIETTEIVALEENLATEAVNEVQDETDQSPAILALEKHAEALLNKVKQENRFVKFLDETALVDLPIGLVSEDGMDDYAILIDSLVITPTHAYLTVYMCIPIPQSDKKMVFRGDNIRLGKNGGITGDARLSLVNDIKGINVLGSKATMTILGGTENTNAIWDCNGFKEISLSADVAFSRDWLLPLSGTGQIKSHFKTTIREWNDLLLTIDLDPFTLASLPSVEFHARNAVFDFSDSQTPETIQFPDGYSSPQFIENDKRLWRGFYMDEVTVVMPPEFKLKNSSKRISVSGKKLLIDNRGFSGKLSVNNLFDVASGDMDGWGYSLDSLFMTIEANSLIEGGFVGAIQVPLGEGVKPFSYAAIMSNTGDYVFNVSPDENLDFEAFNTELALLPSSYIEVAVVNHEFKPKAVLSGTMDVRESSSEISLLGIEFEELTIATQSPYLDVKSFSYGSDKLENSEGGFPVSISDIEFENIGDNRASLNFTLKVHMTGEDDGGFYGEANLQLFAERNTVTQKWSSDGANLSRLAIDVDAGTYAFKGYLEAFEKDEVFGKGFTGAAELSFEPGVKVSGSLLFGKVDDYRYWYADALHSSNTGTPLCGPLSMYGFGGGMYHNMEQMGYATEAALELGKTPSGIVYSPNKAISYGFKASIEVGLTSSKETFNGDAVLDMSFYERGGVKNISLFGNGYVLTQESLGDYEALESLVKNMAESEDAYGANTSGDYRYTTGSRPEGKEGAMMSGHFFQNYDFNSKVLHGELELYVDVFGGLKGTGPDGLAGWAVMHFSPDEWFVNIGTPDRRIGLNALGLATMDSYLMVGNQIPELPALPSRVSSLLVSNDRDEASLASGRGVAFGASFAFDSGEKKYLMFYGQFAMGMGFDLMLKNYGTEASCQGSNTGLGINGWYGQGQAYAFMEGNVGVKVELFSKEKNIDILSLSAATLFQAKLPNPIWMKGSVGGRYSVLGGMVKGTYKLDIEIGEQCEIQNGSAIAGLSVIGDVTPQSGREDESVFVSPQAVFNFEIGKAFKLEDIDGEEQSFRILLDHFYLESDKGTFTSNLAWNEDHTVAIYDNYEMLAPNTVYKVFVQVGYEEIVDGAWQKVKINGEAVTEHVETSFTTGAVPDYIPKENVAFSYPVMDQYNFYQDEYAEGFVMLKKNQDYLFESSDNWDKELRFITSAGDTSRTSFLFADNKITYDIPSGLRNDVVYKVQVVNVPKQAQGNLDGNVYDQERTVEIEGAQTDTKVTTQKAEGTVENLKETIIFVSTFRTSKYNTFTDKMNNQSMSTGARVPDARGQSIHYLANKIRGDELFDKAELEGVNNQLPLVDMVADLSTNSYYLDHVYPLVYENYQDLTVPQAQINRTDKLGVPPVKAVYVHQYPTSLPTLSSADFNTGVSEMMTEANFMYELPYYMKNDYQDLQAQTISYCLNKPERITPRRNSIISDNFPIVTKGTYQVRLTYTIPGVNIITSSLLYNLNNPVR